MELGNRSHALARIGGGDFGEPFGQLKNPPIGRRPHSCGANGRRRILAQPAEPGTQIEFAIVTQESNQLQPSCRWNQR